MGFNPFHGCLLKGFPRGAAASSKGFPEGLPPVPKGFPLGGSCHPQAADEGGVCVASLLTGNTRRLSPHPSAGGAADTFSPKGRRLLSVLKASPEGLRPQAADEGGVCVASLLTGNTRRLSPHPSAGGAADTFSPRGRRLLSALKASPEGLPSVLKASPSGEAAARRRLMRAEFT